MKLEFIDRFSNNIQATNIMKILPVGVELLHAERRTDMKQVNVPFRNFTKAPKKLFLYTP